MKPKRKTLTFKEIMQLPPKERGEALAKAMDEAEEREERRLRKQRDDRETSSDKKTSQ